MMIYRNRNYFNNTFRYKKVDENTSDYIGIEHSKRIIKYNETTSVNGKKFHYVPYDYHPRWLFKILWNFQTWYKRPKLKNIQTRRITSTISNLSSKAVGIIISSFLLPLLVLILWFKYKTEIIELWNKWFE